MLKNTSYFAFECKADYRSLKYILLKDSNAFIVVSDRMKLFYQYRT